LRFEKLFIFGCFGILIFFIIALSTVYNNVKERTIEDLNNRQLVHAQQASRGIQDHMDYIIGTLEHFSRMKGIIDMDADGKGLMNAFQDFHKDEVKGITRVDAFGRILYTVPYNKDVIGMDISNQEHVREILKTHKLVISDVFTAVQGYRAVAVHVPVFKDAVFDGTIAFLISFDRLAQRHIENIQVGKSGYAWVISRKGTEIYCPVPGHIGRSVFDTCKDFPEIIAMARKMMQGKAGITTYHFNQVRGASTEKTVKQAVYMPIPIGNTFWSIVVATPEDEVLNSLAGLRTKIILITIALLVFLMAFTYFIVKSQIILREQKKREAIMKSLEENEKKYRTLIETTGTGFVIVDQEGRVLDANLEYVHLTGHYNLSEIQGRSVVEWTAEYEKEKNTNAVAQCFSNGSIRNFEIDYVDSAGNIKPIEINATVVELDGAKRILTLCRDISSRRESVRALRESESKYRLLTEKMDDIVWTTDLNLAVTYSSPSVEKILGFTQEERLNQSVMDRLTPASLARAQDLLGQELLMEKEGAADPGRIVRVELEYYRKDGSTVWMENVISAIRDDAGNMIGIHGVSRDITERKNAEKDKEKLQDQLNQAQKMEAIGTLAGGIAHDFNNILMAIIGYTQLALEGLSHPEKVIRELREVLKASERAKDLVSQILTFSRKAETTYAPLPIRSVLEESLKMMRSIIPTTIEIRQNLSASGLIMSNPTQMHQIIMNLCTNAAHAMEEGGILEISLEKTKLDPVTARILDVEEGSYFRICIRDTGQGMNPDIIERIFDPYFTTKEKGRGTGLGLSVVHGIVKSHKGAILCRSEPGKGTTFIIYLPEIETESGPDVGVPDKILPRGNERILVVDDEPTLTELVEKILGSLGYRVIARTDSRDALELFERDPAGFDMVITDMTMPGMRGDQLALKLLEIRPDIPIILCSGYSEHISAEKAGTMGIRAYVSKPLDVQGLALTVRDILDGRQPSIRKS
jgi:two-component system, cell cycle sensor histidine kinase and response regulator CckA